MAATLLDTNVARVKPTTRSIQAITNDDTKVLGRLIERKREKTIPPSQFKTRLFKTHHSNWTPVVHRPSNEQIYKERQELIANWFDLWTDSQRKRFLNVIFSQCKRSQLHFVQQWFNERVPLKHLDPTGLLPRFLSLYILSFLDPRSLCRAAAVCWHWKFLTEQDVIWMPKCTRRGWYLPYTPADNEYGAWKRHFVACILTLDMNAPSKNRNDKYGALGDGTEALLRSQKQNRSRRLDSATSSEILVRRPPWMPTDHSPKDLELSSKALYQQFNPNDPQLDPSLLLYHNKFGILKSLLRSSFPGTEPQSFGLQSAARLDKHRMLEAGEDNAGEKPLIHKAPLSRSLELESFREKRLLELVEQPWEPPRPVKDVVARRPDLSGGAAYPVPWKHTPQTPASKSFPMEPHPRVIFISSRVPASELLVDSVLFGVIPIVYEYEGTSVQALTNKLEKCLQGRNAQSIGIFVHSTLSSEIQLVHGATMFLDNLDTPDFVTFFSTLSSCVLPSTRQGHIDIFAPLASCEPGMEMLVQLNMLTGTQFTSPTGIIGNYNHINSEWLPSPEKTMPPSHYFCMSKLNAWANTADQVQEACCQTKQLIGRYFEQKHRDLVAQLVGQTIFDAMGQVDICGTDTIGEALLDGLLHLGKSPAMNPLEFLGRFLLAKVGVKDIRTTARDIKQMPDGATVPVAVARPLATTVSLSSQLELDEAFEESLGNSEATEGAVVDGVDGEVADINGGRKDSEKENRDGFDEDKDQDEAKAESIPEEIVTEDEKGQKVKVKQVPQPKRSRSPGQANVTNAGGDDLQMTFHDTSIWGDTVDTFNFTALEQLAASDTRTPRLLTTQQLVDHPDRRSTVAREILASEINYMRTLDMIRRVFYKPLKSALDSNRAIISAHNLKMIFSDILILLDLSREFVEDLRNRLSSWSADKCLGDLFVKFTGTLKVYVNFLNNYPVLLRMIERCLEQSAIFRAFLKRHERTVAAKMLTLPELLLAPSRRINEYVTLLTWFQRHTPPNHADRSDLQAAIVTFTELNNLSQEHKLRLERERELMELQKKIVSCPSLMEANRFFIKQLDVAHLKPPSRRTDTIRPEHRTYQHIEMLGLFLFNDSLVITRRTTRNFPFDRAVEHTYRFEACASLNRLRVEDIADSKYVTNALRMYTPKRSWVCGTDTAEDKFTWISVLEQNIRAALVD